MSQRTRPETPGEVFARRMRTMRMSRGWTQADLADELSGQGWPVDRVQVARIELGRRSVALGEAIQIAWVLGVPPALLYLPLGEADEVAIFPDVLIHPDQARKWVVGAEPPTYSDQRVRGGWGRDMEVWRLHERLAAAQRAYHDAKAAVAMAVGVKDKDEEKVARHALLKALKGLQEMLDIMRDRGLAPPEIHEATVEEMRLVGIEYQGPSYPGAGKTTKKGGKR